MGRLKIKKNQKKKSLIFSEKIRKNRGGFKNKTLIKTPTSPRKTDFVFQKIRRKKRSAPKRLIFFF